MSVCGGAERLRPARGERVFERRSASERGWAASVNKVIREHI
jgi:hypothetical protein